MAFDLIKWVKNDTKPIPQWTIMKAGAAVNLNGTVKFKIYPKGSTTQSNTGHDTCTIIIAGDGTCKYTPTASDTATVGLYEGALVCTFLDGSIQTVHDKVPIEVINSTAQLCTIGDVEAITQLAFTGTSTPTADQVANWITSASSQVESYTGRKYSEVTVTSEKHNGDGSNLIMLDHYPITSITTLTVDTDALVENTDFWIEDADAGIIRTLTASLEILDGDSQGHHSIVAAYKYGITTIPADVKEFCALIVALKVISSAGLVNTSQGALKSYSDGRVSISYSDTDKAAAGLLVRYNELKETIPRKLGMATGSM